MPPLPLSTGSKSNARKSSVSISEMSSICGQVNAEILFIFLANFTVGCL
jgi:hypothetical protein